MDDLVADRRVPRDILETELFRRELTRVFDTWRSFEPKVGEYRGDGTFDFVVGRRIPESEWSLIRAFTEPFVTGLAWLCVVDVYSQGVPAVATHAAWQIGEQTNWDYPPVLDWGSPDAS